MSVTIHPTAIVEEGAVLKDGVKIGPFCIVDSTVTLGENTELQSHVVIKGRTVIGKNNIIYPFASLGQVPQDLKYNGEDTTLIIGDGNTIRESVTMSIGTEGGGGETIVGDNNLFMALAHVGHDAIVGNNNVFANGATLAGHVEIGNHTVLGGLSAVHQFTRIGNYVMVGGMTAVDRDVIHFGVVSGTRGVLAGLNLRGLKRHGFEKARIAKIREYYHQIFEDQEGNLDDRLNVLLRENGDCGDLLQWHEFISHSSRGMSMPRTA
tara:strand:- start:185727 stop:186521 length:795 start_codon:yes stop_codon:yes gene_type:complete